MGHILLNAKIAKAALAHLDGQLSSPAHLVIGGGAAMVLAYNHPLATEDMDAFTARGGLSMHQLDAAAKHVAKEMGIAPDWLNAHFETYTHVLPHDYAKRLRAVFQGKQLRVDALGPEDLLIMKCFAARDKDRPHARKLIRVAKDLSVVENQLARLVEKRIPGAPKAADYFDDLQDELSL